MSKKIYTNGCMPFWLHFNWPVFCTGRFCNTGFWGFLSPYLFIHFWFRYHRMIDHTTYLVGWLEYSYRDINNLPRTTFTSVCWLKKYFLKILQWIDYKKLKGAPKFWHINNSINKLNWLDRDWNDITVNHRLVWSWTWTVGDWSKIRTEWSCLTTGLLDNVGSLLVNVHWESYSSCWVKSVNVFLQEAYGWDSAD